MSGSEIVEGYTPNFEAWIRDFNEWQTRIGFDPSWLGDYRFDIKFDWDTAGDPSSLEISKACQNGKEGCRYRNRILEMQ